MEDMHIIYACEREREGGYQDILRFYGYEELRTNGLLYVNMRIVFHHLFERELDIL